MAEDIKKGKLKQIKGKAREEAGKLTGNKTREIKGKEEQSAGKVQEQYGEKDQKSNRKLV